MWTAKGAYLVDVFSRLNDLNSYSLQGDRTKIFTLLNKTDAFKKTFDLGEQCAERRYPYVSMLARCPGKICLR